MGAHLEPVREISLGQPLGQLRATPVRLGPEGPHALLLTYGADFDVDPYVEMFFFPTGTLKMALVSTEGEVLWKRDLGPGVVPGIWFCPVLAFDLDGDGCEEIWYVGNTDPSHPLALSHYVLQRLDPLTGKPSGQWAWPRPDYSQNLSHLFRNFIVGGYAHGEPVLVTVQGTYGPMSFQAWRPDMSLRWERRVAESDPGARGSHMCPVVDLNQDGVDELMWGERCLELNGGTQLFCADCDTWHAHSDVAIPTWDRDHRRWYLFTCREGDGKRAPRIALYDDAGRRVWGEVGEGHIDMGWVARLDSDGGQVAMGIRIGHKTCGPDGRFHEGMQEFAFHALSGKPRVLPFSAYRTLPVDLNGDGRHELVRGQPGGDGAVLDADGEVIGTVGGPVALAGKFLDLPGEQLLSFHRDGTVRLWADGNARDSEEARARYANPFYRSALRLMSVGYNLPLLGGI
jgi:hypothetical protein